jgi:hypothetical protein
MREANGPVDEYNDFGSLLARYSKALSRLTELGVRVSKSSRLYSFQRHIQTALDDPRPALEAEFVYAMAFDLREVDEIIEIVDYLPPEVPPETVALLNKLHGGANHPDDESSSPAREAQYELYLGTVFRRAGFGARHGSPDLVVTSNNVDYYVEAKRPASPDGVDRQIRSAIHQLRRLDSPGVIALSLDQVIRPRHNLLVPPSAAMLAPIVAQRLRDFIRESVGIWRNRLAGERIGALLLTARLPARLEPSGLLCLGTNVDVEVFDSEGDVASVSAFVGSAAKAYMAAQRPVA